MSNFGFIKVAAAVPEMRVADPVYNATEIVRLIKKADLNDAAVIVFPELSLTGYTCGDLFGQKLLLDKSLDALQTIAAETETVGIVALVGLPLLIDQKLFNCAAVVHRGVILGVVPKMYLANYKEFYENRWFTSGQVISSRVKEIDLLGKKVPFGHLIFRSVQPHYTLGIELCEDLWAVIPESSYMAINGATVIANLSASNELVCKSDYRRQLVAQQSARCMCGYVYSSSGVWESTTDLVFGGDCIISEDGYILETAPRFKRQSSVTYAEIDVERLVSERQLNKTFAENYLQETGQKTYRTVEINHHRTYSVSKKGFTRTVSRHPFVPDNPRTRDERCEEIFNIQVAGLAKRIEHTGMNKAVIGVSGGLDSTLALLVTARTFDLLGISLKNIHSVTMPGFGTTDETYNNAVKLIKTMKANMCEVDIKPACLQHFKDIGHSPDKHDITFENVQARERTQILMDMANKIGGLVIGTGDLSELALGWATYNGDHMSMYAVNCSIPKTLVKFLVRWIADNAVSGNIKDVLTGILDTPISPELLPPDDQGKIRQKTEDLVGPYELHDFFLYYGIRFGMTPSKVLFLAEVAFAGRYKNAEIRRWLEVFYRRFFAQQFKRSCLPDGPKVGTISLSPRGDWRMPSDAEARIWLAELR